MNHSSHGFDQLYRHSNDPWGYDHRWYEARKRQICLALLTQKHYQTVLEIGCSNGHLSEYLAQRADSLLCVDVSAQAVQLASQRLQAFRHVTIENKRIPEAFPQQKFDLIVISEVAYYLSELELSQLIEQLNHALTPTGELLCCHWRHAIEGFELDAQQVHQCFQQQLPFQHYLKLHDPDFIIDLWTVQSDSLAQQEGLI